MRNADLLGLLQVLVRDGTIVDALGAVGTRPDGHSWAVDDGAGHNGGAKDQTLVRIESVTSGTADWELVGMHQWRAMAKNDFSGIGTHVCGKRTVINLHVIFLSFSTPSLCFHCPCSALTVSVFNSVWHGRGRRPPATGAAQRVYDPAACMLRSCTLSAPLF